MQGLLKPCGEWLKRRSSPTRSTPLPPLHVSEKKSFSALSPRITALPPSLVITSRPSLPNGYTTELGKVMTMIQRCMVKYAVMRAAVSKRDRVALLSPPPPPSGVTACRPRLRYPTTMTTVRIQRNKKSVSVNFKSWIASL